MQKNCMAHHSFPTFTNKGKSTFCGLIIFGYARVSHIKSFAYGHLPSLQKYFLVYCMNFDHCLQTKEKNKNKKKHSTVIPNFYFLVSDYLES